MTDHRDIYGQTGFACRFDWGLRGTRDAAERGDVIVLVDVLSFTSTTTTGVAAGAEIFPYPMRDGAVEFAREVGAELRLGDAVPKGSRALSPLLFTDEDRGKKYVLCSPNGATCAQLAPAATALFAGSLLNASAIAREAERVAQDAGVAVTVVACGEQWIGGRDGENVLRPCVEDMLGAGAIMGAMGGDRSPEAEMCAGTYRAVRERVADLLWDCASGRELRAIGFADDVRYCANVDALTALPRLSDGRFVAVH